MKFENKNETKNLDNVNIELLKSEESEQDSRSNSN